MNIFNIPELCTENAKEGKFYGIYILPQCKERKRERESKKSCLDSVSCPRSPSLWPLSLSTKRKII